MCYRSSSDSLRITLRKGQNAQLYHPPRTEVCDQDQEVSNINIFKVVKASLTQGKTHF